MTIELDEKRSCRFIMLKPTGLRQQKRPYKPQQVDTNPMELEFFGAQGTSTPYDLAADYFEFSDNTTLNAQDSLAAKMMQSGFKLVISDLSGKEIITIDKVPITSYRINEVPLTAKQVQGVRSIVPLGQSILKLTDSKIS